MSLFVSVEAADQIREMDKNPSLMNIGLHDVLKNIDDNGIDKLTKDIHKLSGTEEDIYVLKYHSLRLFFTKNKDGVVLMNILKRKG